MCFTTLLRMQQPWSNLNLPQGLLLLFQHHLNKPPAASKGMLCKSLSAIAAATCDAIRRGLSGVNQRASAACHVLLTVTGCYKPRLHDGRPSGQDVNSSQARFITLAELLLASRADPACKDTAQRLSQWVVPIPVVEQHGHEHVTHILLRRSLKTAR